MPRVLFVASDLGASGPARLVSLLAPALPRPRFEVAVVDLTGGASDVLLGALQAAGVPCYHAALRRLTDLRGLRNLHRVVSAFASDVIHVGGPKAAWALSLMSSAGTIPFAKVVASGLDAPRHGLAAWSHRTLTARVARFVAPTQAEAARYRANGVLAGRVTVIPPGVAACGPPPDGAAFRATLDIPAGARLVVAAGRFDRVAGLKSAVWAFDVVKYVAPDLYLVLVGDGTERERLGRFAKALGFDDDRVRFAGLRSDLPAVLGLADLVWVTHERGGVNVALEAMAAGTPVVAFRTPDLAEVVVEGVTGRLVAPGDRVRLAAVANELLEAPDAARAAGEAGRRRAAEHFGVAAMASGFATLYDELVRTPPPAADPRWRPAT